MSGEAPILGRAGIPLRPPAPGRAPAEPWLRGFGAPLRGPVRPARPAAPPPPEPPAADPWPSDPEWPRAPREPSAPEAEWPHAPHEPSAPEAEWPQAPREPSAPEAEWPHAPYEPATPAAIREGRAAVEVGAVPLPPAPSAPGDARAAPGRMPVARAMPPSEVGRAQATPMGGPPASPAPAVAAAWTEGGVPAPAAGVHYTIEMDGVPRTPPSIPRLSPPPRARVHAGRHEDQEDAPRAMGGRLDGALSDPGYGTAADRDGGPGSVLPGAARTLLAETLGSSRRSPEVRREGEREPMGGAVRPPLSLAGADGSGEGAYRVVEDPAAGAGEGSRVAPMGGAWHAAVGAERALPEAVQRRMRAAEAEYGPGEAEGRRVEIGTVQVTVNVPPPPPPPVPPMQPFAAAPAPAPAPSSGAAAAAAPAYADPWSSYSRILD